MDNKLIIMGVSASVAIYKAIEIIRLLQREDIDVKVIMTRNAKRMISPLLFSAVSHNKVYHTQWSNDVSEIEHIILGRGVPIFLIAPATANIIGKLANGIADDFLTTFFLGYTGRVVIAPAMNAKMYTNSIVQRNISLLQREGVIFVNPEEGYLACGEEGKGRLAKTEVIISTVIELLRESASLKGKKVLVTAGPTHERIDVVRYISNYSSGKMGYALAMEAAKREADVILISGPTTLLAPSSVHLTKVLSAEEMKNAVLSHYNEADVVIMAAAVADYKPAVYQDVKIKKSEDNLNLRLLQTDDILNLLGKRKTKQVLIGFAAEKGLNIEEAKDKLNRKNADAILLNDIFEPDVGFGVDTNRVIWIDRMGEEIKSDKLYKNLLAKWIWDRICERFI